MDYYNKYIKYKNKYIQLKNQIGSSTDNQIAFLFMTRKDVNYPNIWKKYFENNENKYDLYIHPKNPKEVKSFLKNNIINEYVETQWGDISLTKVMIALLKQAFKNNKNNTFVFLSESCLPVKNFNTFYNKFNNIKKSYFTLGNYSGQHMSRFKYLNNPKKFGINKKNFYKSETWCILCREHVKTILQNYITWLPVFKDVYIPEEHFFITLILIKHDKKSFLDYKTTFTYWNLKISKKHPVTFGPFINKKHKKIIINKLNTEFFARKFKYEKNNNIKEFILKLIKI
jgi:hypothetical protein